MIKTSTACLVTMLGLLGAIGAKVRYTDDSCRGSYRSSFSQLGDLYFAPSVPVCLHEHGRALILRNDLGFREHERICHLYVHDVSFCLACPATHGGGVYLVEHVTLSSCSLGLVSWSTLG